MVNALRFCDDANLFHLNILKNILQKIVVKLIEAEKILFKCNSARKKEMETKARKNNKADFPHFFRIIFLRLEMFQTRT